MNQTFQINRFLRFLGKEFYEQRKFLIYSSLAIFGILAFLSWLLLDSSSANFSSIEEGIEYYSTQYNILYFLGLCVMGVAVQNIAFSQIHKKGKGTYYLMQPVSMLEKFISKLLIQVLLFYIIYTISFFIVKSLTDTFIIKFDGEIPFPSIVGRESFFFFMAILTVHAFYLAGSATFRRLNFLFCSILIVLIITIGFLFLNEISYFISPYVQNMLFIANENVIYTNTDAPDAANLIYYTVNVGHNAFTGFLRTIEYFSILPLLWLYTWFKFKEKQV